MSVTSLDPAELAARATVAVASSLPGATVTDVEQLIGGTSSLTYAAWLQADGQRRKVVIKAAPPGLEPVRNRDVLRQARLFEVLIDHPAVKVPVVYGTSTGEPPEVPPLFVMSFVPGESYEPAFQADEPACTRAELRSRAFAAARMGAALHAIDVSDPRLAGERITDVNAEVERWAKAFASVDADLQEGADAIRDALRARVPEVQPPSVLHGDFRLGNMQCNGGSVDALIDWEIWSLGDRRLDLAWFLLNSDPKHPGSRRADTGMPALAELVAAYEEAAGTRVTGLDWFNALVRYKQAAASALIIKNNRKLPQPGVDPESMLGGLGKLLAAARDHLA